MFATRFLTLSDFCLQKYIQIVENTCVEVFMTKIIFKMILEGVNPVHIPLVFSF